MSSEITRSEITPEHIQASEEMCRALREAIETAQSEETKAALEEHLNQAEHSHQDLCRAQTEQLQQMYLQNMLARMMR